VESDFWEQRLAMVTAQPDRAAAVSAEIAAVGVYVQRLAESLTGHDAAAPAQVEPLAVNHPVLGVDGCAGGWVGVLLEPGAPRPRVLVASTLDALVEMVRESVEPAVVAVAPGDPATTDATEVHRLRATHPRLSVHLSGAAPFASLAELTTAGLAAPSSLAGRGYGETDVLAACAAAAATIPR
jgi:hypothetical protein